ncbi:hypothetical protein J4416_03745 [Candidatus Pacearchaeota archaeon]|nr:hypothetical protein [Candidatus Pacearchaeota archaeon]
MKLREKIKNGMVRLLGNRVTLGSALALTLGLVTPSMLERDNIVKDLLMPLSIATAIVGVSGIASTKAGSSTYELYRRTKEHIQERGYLDERFVERVIKKSGNETFTGYCQQQGAYLAAREVGQENVFHEARRKYSNVCIPFI